MTCFSNTCGRAISSGTTGAFERSFQQFLEGKKDDPPFLAATGCFLDDELGPEVALRCFDTALKRDPDASYAWFNKGVTLHRSGKEGDALRCYESALRLDRTHGFARLYLALILIKKGKREEALWHVQKFAEGQDPHPMQDLMRMALQGAAMGIPLETLLMPLADPAVLKHLM